MGKRSASSDLAMMQRNAAKAEALLKLLGNSKRLLILCHLLKAERPVGELAERVGLSHSALSQHLAKMRQLKVVKTRKHGQMVYYRIASPEAEAILATLYRLYCRA